MNQKDVLKQYFGYGAFRRGQEEVIDHILAGEDTVGIMPTGAGKSLCFQVPALLLEGVTLVISPLISLMQDQVQALTAAGVAAAFINSSLSAAQTARALKNAEEGRYKIIYVAPERLDLADFLAFALGADIAMVTVDEAHCVSQWGQDFRPSYLKIAEFIEALPKRPVVSAFTATATDEVKTDMVRLLGLRHPFLMATGFNRENLYFEVQKPAVKYRAVTDYLKANPGSGGIIYCATRKTVEQVCAKLQADGYDAKRYHAGLSEGERTRNQDDFIYDRTKIMVATNAFGMGIDKSNVSFVIHYNMPKNMESYYQEAGRAGRDGAPADCILLYGAGDVVTCRFFIDNSRDQSELDPETQRAVREKDLARLQQMKDYCFTSGCLRQYIMDYFGQREPVYCANCGNCNAKFAAVDCTEAAQKILSCVGRMEGRFGAKILIDTLRGSRSEKLTACGLDRLSTYGIMADVSAAKLRELVSCLTVEGYLALTDSEYPVVRLGSKARDVLFGGARVELRLSQEEKKARKERALPFAVDPELFEHLKRVRLALAQAQGVPAFVVFSDTTLMDMCGKLPQTPQALLEVSGVGTTKLERYGDAFLEVLCGCGTERPAPAQAVPTGALTEFLRAQVAISEVPLGISRFADGVSAALIRTGREKISGVKLAGYLTEWGYLEARPGGRIPTEKGAAIGIEVETRTKASGETYQQNLYSAAAQETLLAELGRME
ncbi:MAG: DNA helicase RecQ [Pseudoflavonifractor sp.]